MEISGISRSQVIRNSIWKFSETIGVQLFQAIITIILARLLSPNDYGLMSIIMIATNFLALFVNSGISSYLVYLKDIKKQDFLTALIFNLVVSLLLMGLLIGGAGFVAKFYNAPQLTPMIMVTSSILPLGAISSVYNSYAIKMSLHKSLFYRNMIAVPISGILSVVLALEGFGIWTLVINILVYNVLLTIIIALSIKINIDGYWRFEFESLKKMCSYGFFTLLSTIVAFISDNISDLFIGKKINASQLGVYNRGRNFPDYIFSSVNTVISTVLFPAFASYNQDISELKSKCRKSLKLLNTIAFPILFGFIACAPSFVYVVLTDKWSECIPIIQIICLYYCFVPFLQIGSQIYLAIGKTKIRAYGEFIKLSVTLIFLAIFIKYGIIGIAFAKFLVGFVMFLYSVILNYRFMKYNILELLIDCYKPLLSATLMAVAIYPLTYLHLDRLVILIIQILVGVVIYTISSLILKNEDVNELVRKLFVSFRTKNSIFS